MLKHNENLVESDQTIIVNTPAPSTLKIPDYLMKKVPHHWHQFLEDSGGELKSVKSKIYDGGVSKGLKHGQG